MDPKTVCLGVRERAGFVKSVTLAGHEEDAVMEDESDVNGEGMEEENGEKEDSRQEEDVNRGNVQRHRVRVDAEGR